MLRAGQNMLASVETSFAVSGFDLLIAMVAMQFGIFPIDILANYSPAIISICVDCAGNVAELLASAIAANRSAIVTDEI